MGEESIHALFFCLANQAFDFPASLFPIFQEEVIPYFYETTYSILKLST